MVLIIGIALFTIGVLSLLFQSYRKTRKEISIFKTKRNKYKSFLNELDNLLK